MNTTVIILSFLFVLFYTLLVTWSANNYKRSIKKEYEDKLKKANLKISEQDTHIQNLSGTNKILLTRLSDRGNEIEKLHAKIYNTGVFRNVKGQFQRI